MTRAVLRIKIIELVRTGDSTQDNYNNKLIAH